MKLTCPVCEMTFERFGEMGAFIDHTNAHIFLFDTPYNFRIIDIYEQTDRKIRVTDRA